MANIKKTKAGTRVKKTKTTVKKFKTDKQGKLIGKIIHYFSNIEVAVVNLAAPLKEGDEIRVVGGEATDFEQTVGSLQIDRKKIKSGKRGDSVGMKVDEKVHDGYKVYKL